MTSRVCDILHFGDIPASVKGLVFGVGNKLPENGYCVGALFVLNGASADNGLYTNAGTETAPSWKTVTHA